MPPSTTKILQRRFGGPESSSTSTYPCIFISHDRRPGSHNADPSNKWNSDVEFQNSRFEETWIYSTYSIFGKNYIRKKKKKIECLTKYRHICLIAMQYVIVTAKSILDGKDLQQFIKCFIKVWIWPQSSILKTLWQPYLLGSKQRKSWWNMGWFYLSQLQHISVG